MAQEYMKKLWLSALVLAGSVVTTSVHAQIELYDDGFTQSGATTKMALLNTATAIQVNLSNNNFTNIAQYIHPKKGVQFSMYAYIQPKKDKRFSQKQFVTYLQKSKIKFTWGQRDGSGELYIRTLPKYIAQWVQPKKFDNGTLTVNRQQGFGNSLNNLRQVYPASAGFNVVDFYYEGTKQYEHMDWQVMRLVFEEYQGKSYLVAMVTDMWTI